MSESSPNNITCVPSRNCFDLNGRVPNGSAFCPEVLSARSCIGGRNFLPEFTLVGDIGSATSVNQILHVPGFGGIQTSSGSPIFNITDLRNLSPYVVGEDAADSEFTNVQDAIDRAVSDGSSPTNQQVIFIKAGTYIGDVTLASNVHLSGLNRDASKIVGNVSLESTSDVSISDLSIENSSTTAVVSGSGTSSNINFQSIRIKQTGSGEALLLADSFSVICMMVAISSTTGIAINNIGTGEFTSRNCEITSTGGTALRANAGGAFSITSETLISGSGLAVDLSDTSRITLLGSIIASGGVLIIDTARITLFQSLAVSGDTWTISNTMAFGGRQEFIHSVVQGPLVLTDLSPVSAQYCVFLAANPSITMNDTSTINLLSCFVNAGFDLNDTSITNFFNSATNDQVAINGSGGAALSGPNFFCQSSTINTSGTASSAAILFTAPGGGVATVAFSVLTAPMGAAHLIDQTGIGFANYRRGVESISMSPVTNLALGTTTINGSIVQDDLTVI